MDKLTGEISYGDQFAPSDWTECFPCMDPWDVTLRFQGETMHVPYFTGYGCRDGGGEPKLSGVLECLILDASTGDQSFEDFCSDFGYDTDSRRAERTWEACVDVRDRLMILLGDEYESALSDPDGWIEENVEEPEED